MIYFSISYSCGYCVFVLSLESEVGIDLEMIRDKRPDFYMNVMNQSFSDEEKQLMHGEINDDFFWETWTIKEAVVKYSGAGLLYDLKKISHQGHVVYWTDASESLSLGRIKSLVKIKPLAKIKLALVKIKLGQCVIALVAESGCVVELETYSDQWPDTMKTAILPVLQ